MSIDLDSRLVETAQKVTTTQNEYGDIQYGSAAATNCLYRDKSTLNQAANKEEVTIDGILWFSASEVVARGDIYYHSSEGYLRIVNITRAKRLLADNSLQFIRCQVAKQRQIS